MKKANNNIANQIMRYGIWHGRGYSNGWNTPRRKFSDDEKRAPGIDAYDNFVAKAHDLNEIVAEELLRIRLAEVGYRELEGVSANSNWQNRLETKSDRVLDFEHYYGQAATPEAKRQVADAFAMYESQFMRSNLQYAIDADANRPDVARHGAAAVAVLGQRGVSPHLFLKEAALSGERFKKIKERANLDIETRVQENLKANFVAPGLDNANSRFIQDTEGYSFTRAAPIEAILDAPRQDLLATYGRIQKQRLRTGADAEAPSIDRAASRPDQLPNLARTDQRASNRSDPTPVTVAVPDRATPGGLKPVAMRADTVLIDVVKTV